MENTGSNYQNPLSMFLENPGIEFHPTEKELVCHFLTSKNSRGFINDHINEVNLYGLNPFNLPETASFAYTQRRERHPRWYYYVSKDFIKDQNGMRIANGGYWRMKGPVKSIDGNEGGVIGAKKSFVFYTTNSVGMDLRTDWIMHEFSLFHNPEAPFVLCRLFLRSTSDSVEVIDLIQGDSPDLD